MTERLPGSGRVLGLDYGERRLGVALTDSLQITAQAYDTLVSKRGTAAFVPEISRICEREEVVGIVLGNPIHMSGVEGEMSAAVQEFAQLLRSETGLPVVLLDERLTSVMAERFLRDAGQKASKNKQLVDKIAATLILRSYLDSTSG